jgi:RNA polymerase sigma factor (TIGR02999 family)
MSVKTSLGGQSAAVEPQGSNTPFCTEKAFAELYFQLKRLAKRRLSAGRPDRLLQTTGLVHEVYLRLAGCERRLSWANQAHFFCVASEAMRHVILDKLRAARCDKRFGNQLAVPIVPENEPQDCGIESDRLWETLDEAIDELEQEDSTTAELVKLKLFCGLSVAEAGALLGLSRSKAYEHWAFARGWFRLWENTKVKPQ